MRSIKINVFHEVYIVHVYKQTTTSTLEVKVSHNVTYVVYHSACAPHKFQSCQAISDALYIATHVPST